MTGQQEEMLSFFRGDSKDMGSGIEKWLTPLKQKPEATKRSQVLAAGTRKTDSAGRFDIEPPL